MKAALAGPRLHPAVRPASSNASCTATTGRVEPPGRAEPLCDSLLTPELAFDRITKLASFFFRCPVALLSFVEADRQWFKSCIGVDFGEGPRSESFCSWAILHDEVMVVPDATAVPRFSDNVLVTSGMGIRFYAGAPLISPRGFRIGTFCIIDTKPRPQGLSSEETEALASMAEIAMTLLEARLAAQESEETHSLLQTTLSSIGDGIIITDANSYITFVNPVAEQLTGWKIDEAVGHPIQEVFHIVHEISRQEVANPITRAISQGEVVGLTNHTVLLSKDGREFPSTISAAPIKRGQSVRGGVLVFRDITKRRLEERILEHSETQFRTTFTKAPLGQVLTTLAGHFVESNEAFRVITGFSQDELSSLNIVDFSYADDIANDRIMFHRLIGGEIDSYVLETRIVTKSAAIRWIRAHASLLRDVDGRAVKVIRLVEDITDRKLSEQRFRFLAETIPRLSGLRGQTECSTTSTV